MRAIFLFLVVVVAFLLVLRFYPSDGVEGAEDRGRETVAGMLEERRDEGTRARFATPSPEALSERSAGLDAGLGNGRSDAVREPDVRGAMPAEEAVSSNGAPSWLDELEADPVVARGGRSEVALGEAILHGTVSDVVRLLDDPGLGYDDERCLVVLAFKEAMEGRRQRALEHAEKLGDSPTWRSGEEERLRAALTGAAVGVEPSRARGGGPVAFAMEMSLALREAQVFFEERRYAPAARLFSELIVNELDAPWREHRGALANWGQMLNLAQDEHRWNPRADWPGVEMVVEAGDSLTTIRKRYLGNYPERLMCTGLIAKSNRLTGYLQPGQRLRVPTEPVEVLVDLSAFRVCVLIGGQVARTYEVGTGRAGEDTITGLFTAGEKQTNPSWFPRGQEMVPFGDPRNPLGTRWIPWMRPGGERTSYGFHGTNQPESIGSAASDGCIRFRNAEVEEFFEVVPEGTRITVRP